MIYDLASTVRVEEFSVKFDSWLYLILPGIYVQVSQLLCSVVNSLYIGLVSSRTWFLHHISKYALHTEGLKQFFFETIINLEKSSKLGFFFFSWTT